MRRNKIGEDRIIYTQTTWLAENKEEIRNMIERLERYLERKGLELNMEKIKIMRFRKRNGRLRKRNWK